VDLVIRTGGEPHWSSGFMMWQTANSEFYFTNTYAPAFDEKEFQAALAEYETRRRMGGA
jgi:short-chain Z-isoprenyl diphosphate synthase